MVLEKAIYYGRACICRLQSKIRTSLAQGTCGPYNQSCSPSQLQGKDLPVDRSLQNSPGDGYDESYYNPPCLQARESCFDINHLTKPTF